jgi:hypothetical protein
MPPMLDRSETASSNHYRILMVLARPNIYIEIDPATTILFIAAVPSVQLRLNAEVPSFCISGNAKKIRKHCRAITNTKA